MINNTPFANTPLLTVLDRALAGVGIPSVHASLSGEGLALHGQGWEKHYPLPFRLGQVLDDVRRVGKTNDADQTAAIALGTRWVLLPAPALLRCATTQEEFRLTEKERDILVLLDKHRGTAVDRKTLLDTIWGYAEGVETHTLETHIHRLRRKIETDPATPAILCTDGNGYRLNR